MLERWKCSFISIRFHSFLFFFIRYNKQNSRYSDGFSIHKEFICFLFHSALSLSLRLLVFFRSNFFLSHSFFSVPIMHHLFISEKKNFFPNSISNPTVHRSIWGISFFFSWLSYYWFLNFQWTKSKNKNKKRFVDKKFPISICCCCCCCEISSSSSSFQTKIIAHTHTHYKCVFFQPKPPISTLFLLLDVVFFLIFWFLCIHIKYFVFSISIDQINSISHSFFFTQYRISNARPHTHTHNNHHQ